MSSQRGFTLLECLVALALLAIALTAALRATGSTAQSATMLKEHTLASWVAQNRLAELRAFDIWPNIGNREGEAEQAGYRYRWRETTVQTPNPLFRRVDIQVFAQGDNRPLASLSGFVARPLK